jgi:hypothetical protein
MSTTTRSTRSLRRLGTAIATFSLLVVGSKAASAQERPPPPVVAPPPPPPAPPPPPPAPPPPPPAAAPAPAVAAGDAPLAVEAPTDHEANIHHFGVTYFDVTDLPIANPIGGVGAGLTSSNVSAPVVGIRYWFDRRWGLDVGLGVGLTGGSDQTVAGGTSTTVSKTGSTGFAVHAGVPIALASGKHYTFLVLPQTTIGFTSATQHGNPDQNLSGFLFDIGARIGAEIHFGFIGIPQLALQATLGLSYRRSVYKWSSNGNSASDGTNTFGTNVQSDPWSIFKDAISATYYF